jgi:hypothetical protein
MNRRQLLARPRRLGRQRFPAPARACRRPNAPGRHRRRLARPEQERPLLRRRAGRRLGGPQADIRYAVPLPTRPHGLLAEADGGLLVLGVRPGTWMLRCDGAGKLMQQIRLDDDGATASDLAAMPFSRRRRALLYTTETDLRDGRGRVGVRDRSTLKQSWPSGKPTASTRTSCCSTHEGHVIVANGGVPRTAEDKKFDLHRMEPSLVRLDAGSGKLLRQWRLDDPRLSLRHLAWNTASRRPPDAPGHRPPGRARRRHRSAKPRPYSPCSKATGCACRRAPTTASAMPATSPPPATAASSPRATRPGWPSSGSRRAGPTEHRRGDQGKPTPWPPGPARQGRRRAGRHRARPRPLAPHRPAALLPWPQPMALDNHWVLLGEGINPLMTRAAKPSIAHAYPIDFNNQLDAYDCYI